MSTARGDGEIGATHRMADSDMDGVERKAAADASEPPEDVSENTLVMDDSQLRELVSEDDVQPEPDPEQEAAMRKQREAERAAREREEALARVRAHRRQSANTRALRPAGTTEPDAKVSLSKDALAMLDREIERSTPPPPSARKDPPPAAKQGVTSRPKRGTAPLGKPRMPPPAPMPDMPLSVTRTKQVFAAIDEIETQLRRGDVAAALVVIERIKRG